MSKVTEECNFLWRERLADYYNTLLERSAYEDDEFGPASSRISAIRVTLDTMGLFVRGINA